MQDLNLEFSTVDELVKYLEKSQYMNFNTVKPSGNIMTRYDLQKMDFSDEKIISRTSGSTGIPVIVPKNITTLMWHTATNVRDLQWRRWDLKLKKVAILAKIKEDSVVGNSFLKKLDSIQNLQLYLEKIQPSYLYTYPSIVKQLDLTKLNLLDIRTVGEIGATSYSCEETGTIALQCEENTYHIMENIIVEVDSVHGILVTDLTNPIITRYALGDVVELGGSCKCGRTLSTISKIYGRVRNMLVLSNGDKIWPTIGEPLFLSVSNKIIRHQMVQTSLQELELRLQVNSKLTDLEERNLIDLVLKTIGMNLKCNIVYVDDFPAGKFEAFLSKTTF
uniref:AMP-dependent synthetase/ligase domain-containing protein n=1 Tax=viral metagenome TaxID=1070528 RepID=A0A6C0CBS5_9ZZZZ